MDLVLETLYVDLEGAERVDSPVDSVAAVSKEAEVDLTEERVNLEEARVDLAEAGWI